MDADSIFFAPHILSGHVLHSPFFPATTGALPYPRHRYGTQTVRIYPRNTVQETRRLAEELKQLEAS